MNKPTQTHNGLPDICGPENALLGALRRQALNAFDSKLHNFTRVKNAFAVALHMHQPLIPAGGPDLTTAELISNLDYMTNHQNIGDNHNAPVFHWCYKRMGGLIHAHMEGGEQPAGIV